MEKTKEQAIGTTSFGLCDKCLFASLSRSTRGFSPWIVPAASAMSQFLKRLQAHKCARKRKSEHGCAMVAGQDVANLGHGSGNHRHGQSAPVPLVVLTTTDSALGYCAAFGLQHVKASRTDHKMLRRVPSTVRLELLLASSCSRQDGAVPTKLPADYAWQYALMIK